MDLRQICRIAAVGKRAPRARACSGPAERGARDETGELSRFKAESEDASPINEYLHERTVMQVQDLLVCRHTIRRALTRRSNLVHLAAFGTDQDPFPIRVDRTDVTSPIAH